MLEKTRYTPQEMPEHPTSADIHKAVAERWENLGGRLVPIVPNEKRPIGRDWGDPAKRRYSTADFIITEDVAALADRYGLRPEIAALVCSYSSGHYSTGLQLHPKHSAFVDFDLDSEEAIKLAAKHLPPGAIKIVKQIHPLDKDRTPKADSEESVTHYIYRVKGSVPDWMKSQRLYSVRDKETVLELRMGAANAEGKYKQTQTVIWGVLPGPDTSLDSDGLPTDFRFVQPEFPKGEAAALTYEEAAEAFLNLSEAIAADKINARDTVFPERLQKIANRISPPVQPRRRTSEIKAERETSAMEVLAEAYTPELLRQLIEEATVSKISSDDKILCPWHAGKTKDGSMQIFFKTKRSTRDGKKITKWQGGWCFGQCSDEISETTGMPYGTFTAVNFAALLLGYEHKDLTPAERHEALLKAAEYAGIKLPSDNFGPGTIEISGKVHPEAEKGWLSAVSHTVPMRGDNEHIGEGPIMALCGKWYLNRGFGVDKNGDVTPWQPIRADAAHSEIDHLMRRTEYKYVQETATGPKITLFSGTQPCKRHLLEMVSYFERRWPASRHLPINQRRVPHDVVSLEPLAGQGFADGVLEIKPDSKGKYAAVKSAHTRTGLYPNVRPIPAPVSVEKGWQKSQPLLQRMLEEHLPEADELRRYLEAIGYILAYCPSLSGEGKIFAMQGPGATFKSQTVGLVRTMIGSANVNQPDENLMEEKHVSAWLDGVDLLVIDEIKDEPIGSREWESWHGITALMKKMTTGTINEVRNLYETPREGYLSGNVLMATNWVPSFGGTTDGASAFSRRLVALPMRISTPVEEHTLGEVSRRIIETGGHLVLAQLAVKAFTEMMERTDGAVVFTETKYSRLLAEKMMEPPMAGFLSMFEIDPQGENGWTSRSEVTEIYKTCEGYDINRNVDSKEMHKVFQMLVKQGGRDRNQGGVRGFQGVQRIDESEQTANVTDIDSHRQKKQASSAPVYDPGQAAYDREPF